MRIGLISDIHSNAPALEVILEHLEGAGVDTIIHAGDLIGYNPYPNEVIQMLKRSKVSSIKGNHEVILLTMDTRRANIIAEMATRWTDKVLSSESREYIANLDDSIRVEFEDLTMAVYHGSPSDVFEYIYAIDATSELLEEANADILVLGHTHTPFDREVKAGLIVNPGSVGQPRDGNWMTGCTILNPEKMEIERVRLPYDVEAVVSKIEEVGLHPALGERLRSGR